MANWKLFGFQITNEKTKDKEGQTDNLVEKEKSFALPQNDDGAVTLQTGAYFGTYVDMEGVVRNEIELITRYREMAMQPELETAVDDIVNEAIVMQGHDLPLDINLDELKLPDKIKSKIREEFKYILQLLNFGNMGSELFRRWYIDGRMFYHVIIDQTQPRLGIKELRYIDPRRIRKVREIQKTKDAETGADIIKTVKEYFLYNERGIIGAHSNLGMRIATDSILNVNSGLMDSRRAMVLSYLHKAIKPLNQLRMVEDATVIYRLSRAPERRVFYIDVGNLPKIKAEQYLRDLMVKYRNKLVYDSATGEIKDDRKHLCLSMDTKVPLLDGRTLTLNEIAQEYKHKKLWAYSCDPITGKFSPGLITWAGVSRPNAKVMRITLDNGETIDCTPDHKFPIWNNGLTMAKDLKVGDSLIPHYTRMHGITPGAKKSKQYEQLWLNDTKEWKFTHKAVSEWKDQVGLDNIFVFNEKYANTKLITVHHVNINRFDNSPENLVKMNGRDHILYHQDASSESGKIGGKNCYEMNKGFHNKNHPDYIEWHVKAGTIGGKVSAETGKSQENFAKGRKIFGELMTNLEYREWFVDRQKEGWTDNKKQIASEHAKKNNLSLRGNAAKKELFKTEERKEKHRKMYRVEYTEDIFNFIKECAIKKYTRAQTIEELNNSNEILKEWQNLNKDKCLNKQQKSFDKFLKSDLDKVTKNYAGTTFVELKQQFEFRNHKVLKVEYLKDRIDTGCLTIDGDELYHNNHTFALAAGVYTQNSMLEDFWLPRREGGKGTEIQTLPGGQNLGEMEDVKYFERKLYKSLGIPISRLEQQQGFSLGRTTEITRDELKFSKFVFRLRNKFSTLFDEALRIQLSLKGICTVEEWNEFKENIYYDFITDNNFEELKKAELIQNRITVLQLADPYIGKYFSMEWARKNILNQNEDEIEQIKKQIEDEKQEMIEMAQKTAEITAIQSGATLQQNQQQTQPTDNSSQPQPDQSAGQVDANSSPDQSSGQVDMNTAFQNTTNPGVSQLDDLVDKNLKVENKSNINNILRIIKDRREVL